ncbi:hypothetical protein AVEN_243701-1 [Araneus ventricosus]|uniref:Uncharacterized protein n=1 Tax=Araneus ventricosus TaxID=182803 RepID=A0A4Y2A7G1_ARAVE|nr:hypothetical protein AVEN_243701-1 [Araneus ventricosus]
MRCSTPASWSKHLWNIIKDSRYLSDDLKKAMDPVINRNSFMAHSENQLLSMLAAERRHIRKRAVRRNIKLFTRIAAVQFNIPELDTQKDIEIGEACLKHLFGGKQINSLDDLRYTRYNKEVTKTFSSNFNLETLPPTSAAASQHSFHAQLQVPHRLGNNLDPPEW